MAGAYGKYDSRVVDYELYQLDPPILDPVTRAPLELRGPRPRSLEPGRYFVCIGGAQTFGRFCSRPFPLLLQDALGLPALNLGRGGAGPSFFRTDDDVLLGYVNRAKFAVVQIMSGRSAGSSFFRGSGLGGYRRQDGSFVTADEAFDELLRERATEAVARAVAETRNDYLRSFRKLLSAMTVPKILLWLSVREPAYHESYESVDALFGPFPQLVNEPMIRELRKLGDGYVSCVSSRGLPQRLVDRETGEAVAVRDEWSGTWRVNRYYPSPEMHQDAATALETAVSRYFGDDESRGGRLRQAFERYFHRE